jgi:hypothetical protein
MYGVLIEPHEFAEQRDCFLFQLDRLCRNMHGSCATSMRGASGRGISPSKCFDNRKGGVISAFSARRPVFRQYLVKQFKHLRTAVGLNLDGRAVLRLIPISTQLEVI